MSLKPLIHLITLNVSVSVSVWCNEKFHCRVMMSPRRSRTILLLLTSQILWLLLLVMVGVEGQQMSCRWASDFSGRKFLIHLCLRPSEDCVSQDDCPEFLDLKEQLDSLNRDSLERASLLKRFEIRVGKNLSEWSENQTYKFLFFGSAIGPFQ